MANGEKEGGAWITTGRRPKAESSPTNQALSDPGTKEDWLRDATGIWAAQKAKVKEKPTPPDVVTVPRSRYEALEDLFTACRALKDKPHEAEMRIIERVEEIDRLEGRPELEPAPTPLASIVRGGTDRDWVYSAKAIGYALCMASPFMLMALLVLFG